MAVGRRDAERWRQMVEIEPKLGTMLAEAWALHESTKDDERFCANFWFHGVWGPEGRKRSKKRELYDLVGWGAHDSRLESSVDYEIAIGEIYAALPNCRDCGCM